MDELSEIPPLLRIPVEIRLMIYELLLDDRGCKTFNFHSESPEDFKTRPPPRRTVYRVLGPGIQRRACNTTYRLTIPSKLETNILAASRQIHHEATWMLYGQHAFDFGVNAEAVVPFLSDLTPSTRAFVRTLSLTKQPAVYSRDFDRCEWSNVCAYLSTYMCLQRLVLRVIGGQPLRGWIPTSYTADEFRTLARAGYDSMAWVQEMLPIRGLEELEVIEDLRPCPPPNSVAMEFFAAFSASIGAGFADYLRTEMIGSPIGVV